MRGSVLPHSPYIIPYRVKEQRVETSSMCFTPREMAAWIRSPIKRPCLCLSTLEPVALVQQNNTFRRALQKKQQLFLPAQAESG